MIFSLLILMLKNSSVECKMLVEKLEIPMPAAMPCRLRHYLHRETCCAVGEHKTKMRPTNLNHEDHTLQEKA